MKNKLFILTIAPAIIGIITSVFFFQEIIAKNRLERAYEANCKNVKIGITLNQAREIMSKGLNINYRGYDYEIQTSMDTISEISMNYPIDGGSSVISIVIDKETGLVQSINCPKNE